MKLRYECFNRTFGSRAPSQLLGKKPEKYINGRNVASDQEGHDRELTEPKCFPNYSDKTNARSLQWQEEVLARSGCCPMGFHSCSIGNPNWGFLSVVGTAPRLRHYDVQKLIPLWLEIVHVHHKGRNKTAKCSNWIYKEQLLVYWIRWAVLSRPDLCLSVTVSWQNKPS